MNLSLILRKLTQYILEYPKWVIFYTVIPCLLASLYLLRTAVDFSFLALLPTQDPILQKFERVGEEIAINNQIILFLEGENEQELDSIVTTITQTLSDNDDVEYAISTPPKAWFEKNIAWITTEDDFEELLKLGDMITNRVKMQNIQKRFLELEQQQKGFRLLWIGLNQDPLDVDINDVLANDSPYDRIEKMTTNILSSSSIKGDYAGMAAIAAQDQRKTIQAISQLTPVSFVLVLLLLYLVEPRISRLMTLGIPMILSLGTTLGLTGLILGEINFVEGFFGMMVFGLGVDFGLHLLVRMREEYQGDISFSEALHKTIQGAGPAIIAGGCTTIGAFFLIGFAEDPTARHLGVSAGIGLLTCLILMFTLLPAMWVIFDQRKEQILPEFHVYGLDMLTKSAITHPKSWIVGYGIVLCISLLGVPKFHFESNLEELFNRDVPATDVGDRIFERLNSNTTPWIFVSDTIEEARLIDSKIQNEELFIQSMGVASLFPEDCTSRHQKLIQAKEHLVIQRKKLQAFSIGPAYLSVPAQKSLPLIESLEQAMVEGVPKIEDLPIEIKRHLISKSGKWITYAYGEGDVLDAQKFRQQRLAAERIDSQAAGIGNFVELAMDFQRPWIFPTTIGILCFVSLVLWIDLRDFRWILLALVPVTCSVLIAFGVMCWLDIGFSILLIIVVPLLLGLGVDDGLHVVHRMREDPNLSPDKATVSVSRAIVMTTLTTCVSFGVLMFANHPGIESMAIALLCGLPLCLFCSVTLIPALAILMVPNRNQ